MKVYKIPKEDLQSYIRGGRTVEVVKLLEVQEQVKKLKEDVEQGWEVAGMLEDVGEKKVKNTIKFMIDMIDEHLVENRKSSNKAKQKEDSFIKKQRFVSHLSWKTK